MGLYGLGEVIFGELFEFVHCQVGVGPIDIDIAIISVGGVGFFGFGRCLFSFVLSIVIRFSIRFSSLLLFTLWFLFIIGTIGFCRSSCRPFQGNDLLLRCGKKKRSAMNEVV